MILLIVGSRNITNFDISPYIPDNVEIIISSGACGVDDIAEKYADLHRLSKYIIRPDYKRYGRGAPLKRNEKMVDMADEVLVIWDGRSKGTKHTIEYDHVYEPFKAFYEDYRDKRGDRTIPSMLLKLPVSWLSNHYNKIYNTFGYFEYDVALESGTSYGVGSPADGPAELYKYRICFKKTFGDRYKTDGQSQFFNKRLLETESNLDDLPCYGGLNMTVDEMKLQHDYFLMELMENIYSEQKEEDKPRERRAPHKNKGPDLSGFVFDDF